MDEMKIVTDFTRGIVSKLVKTLIRKKTGCNMDVVLNKMNVTVNDGKTHIHLDLDAELSKEELVRIMKSFGLD